MIIGGYRFSDAQNELEGIAPTIDIAGTGETHAQPATAVVEGNESLANTTFHGRRVPVVTP